MKDSLFTLELIVLVAGSCTLPVAACSSGGSTYFGNGGTGGFSGSAGGAGSAGVIGSGGSAGFSGAGASGMSGAGGMAGGAGASAGAAGGGQSDPGALNPVNGWVDATTNTVGIQGSIFSMADSTTSLSVTSDFSGSNACIRGTAARVELLCTPPAGMDCYSFYWGAAIGLNLNQPTDPVTMMGTDPLPYDASALTGFAFRISGAVVPASLRFEVEDASSEYCTGPSTPVVAGMNSLSFNQLISECWTTGGVSADGAKSSLVRISWHVVTNADSSVPFDFCVSDIRALQ